MGIINLIGVILRGSKFNYKDYSYMVVEHFKESVKNDPVYTCDTYLREGCSHVDGLLCNPKTCSGY